MENPRINIEDAVILEFWFLYLPYCCLLCFKLPVALSPCE